MASFHRHVCRYSLHVEQKQLGGCVLWFMLCKLSKNLHLCRKKSGGLASSWSTVLHGFRDTPSRPGLLAQPRENCRTRGNSWNGTIMLLVAMQQLINKLWTGNSSSRKRKRKIDLTPRPTQTHLRLHKCNHYWARAESWFVERSLFRYFCRCVEWESYIVHTIATRQRNLFLYGYRIASFPFELEKKNTVRYFEAARPKWC